MKYIITLNDKKYEVEVNESEAKLKSVYDLPKNAATFSAPASPIAPADIQPASAPVSVGAGTKVVSPMPGTILSVNVSVGQQVKSGDVLFILEAMKMENEIVAPSDGTVGQLVVSKGSTVDTDQVLAVIS